MNIDQQREQAITRLYNTPLPNNPNRTYGQVYSPPELAILMVAKNDAIRDAEIQAGNLTQARYNEILAKMPELDEKLAIYNLTPIPYNIEDQVPGYTQRLAESKAAQEEYSRMLKEWSKTAGPGDRPPMPRDGASSLAEPSKPLRFDRKQKIASYGIDPDNPYFFKGQENNRDFYYALSFQPRKLSKENVQFVLDKLGEKGDLQYLDNTNPSDGFIFKPEGSDTYQILRGPDIEGRDVSSVIGREFPALAGDITGTLALGVRGLGSKGLLAALGNAFKVGFGSGVGAAGGDAARLLAGKELGYNDLTLEEIMRESGMTGAFALAGTAGVTIALSTLGGAYRSIMGKQVAPDILEDIQKILDKQSSVYKQKGRSKIIYGADTQGTDQQIQEEIKRFTEIFGAEYRKYNPTLVGRNPLDQDAIDLEYIFLKNAENEDLAFLYSEIMDGNQAVIANLMRSLGEEFTTGPVPAGVEVSEQITQQARALIQRFETEGSQALNKFVQDLKDEVPDASGSLFAKTTQDGVEIIPKTSTVLGDMKNAYLKSYTDNFNAAINKPEYQEFVTGAGYTRSFGREFNTFKNKVIGVLNKKDTIKEIEEVLGVSSGDMTLLKRLSGQATEGRGTLKSPEFTIKELFELQVIFNNLRANSKLDKTRELASLGIQTIQRQVDKAFDDEVARRLGIDIKSRYTAQERNAIQGYKTQNDFGLDIQRAYRQMTQAYSDVNSQVLTQLLKSGNPEQLLPAIMNTSSKGAKTNTPVTEFVKVLRHSGDDGLHYVQKEFYDYVRRNVIDPEKTTLQNNRALTKFYKDNSATIDALGLPNVAGSISYKELGFALTLKDRKIETLKNTFGVDTASVNPVYDVVNNVLRQGYQTKSTGQFANDVDFLLETIKGDPSLQQQVAQLTKNVILRDVMKLQKGAADIFELDANALNRLLFGEFGPADISGPRLNFDATFGKLLGPDSDDTVQALKLINDIAQRETTKAASESVEAGLKRAESFVPIPGFKFLQRMFIPPLTQTGRRVTALDMLMTKRSQVFIGQMIMDPELAKQTIRYAEGKTTLKNFAAFLSSYNTVYMQDIANELQYYDEEMKRLRINEKSELTEEVEDIIDDIMDRYNQ